MRPVDPEDRSCVLEKARVEDFEEALVELEVENVVPELIAKFRHLSGRRTVSFLP